jgi:hypothetical protein
MKRILIESLILEITMNSHPSVCILFETHQINKNNKRSNIDDLLILSFAMNGGFVGHCDGCSFLIKE